MYRTSKVALPALAVAMLLAAGLAGNAIGQTRQVQPEVQRVKPQQRVKPPEQRVKPQVPTQLRARPKGKKPNITSKEGIHIGSTFIPWGGHGEVEAAKASNYHRGACVFRYRFDLRETAGVATGAFKFVLKGGAGSILEGNPGLAAGQVKTAVGKVPLKSGAQSLNVVLDSTGAVAETDEGDNKRAVKVTVKGDCKKLGRRGSAPLLPQQNENGAKSPGGQGGPAGPGGFAAKPPGKLPDFVLEPGLPAGFAEGLPNTGYCLRKPPATSGAANAVAFKIRFKTNGTQSPTNGWGPTKVTIAFQGSGTVTLDVPNASWDGVKPYQLAIPKGCYKPGTSSPCSFAISIDPADIVPETSNANNNVTSICTQPAG